MVYVLLLIYGTWFPLSGWDWSLGGISGFLSIDMFERTTRSDLIINLLVYMPFGLLVTLRLTGSGLSKLLVATLLGSLLSTGLEFGQTYLPNRVTSLADIILNTTGTLTGAISALGATGIYFWLNQGSKTREATDY